MAESTNIEWTDATWQIVTGCDIESPGCKNCYAMKLAGGRLQHHPSRIGLTKPSAAGPVWTGEIRFNEQWLRQPLEWKRPRMIFVAAHGDLFHPGVTEMMLDNIFGVMWQASHHTFQVLTKRAERAAAYMQLCKARGEAVPPNVLIGVSVENQMYADKRRESLRTIAALGWPTWVSYEPALGPVDWTDWEFIRWLVSGGESGQGARPSHPDWHRAARDYCEAHGIAFLFKQHGNWMPISQMGNGDGPGCSDDPALKRVPRMVLQLDGSDQGPQAFPAGAMTMFNVGKAAAGRLLDGKTHDGFPEVRNA